MDYSPTTKKKKVYTEGQQKILDTIFDFGGDVIACARAAGYSNPYAAADSLTEELVELAERAMSRLSIKSVITLEKVLDSDGEVKQANEKLKACQLILDRTNPKTEKIDIEGQQKIGVFLLPAKKPIDEQTDI